MFFGVAMSAEESLHEEESEPTDGEMYEVGGDDGGDDAGDGGQPSWSSLTVAALRAALVVRGLQTTGRKADLVARLEASHSGTLPLSFFGTHLVTVYCLNVVLIALLLIHLRRSLPNIWNRKHI